MVLITYQIILFFIISLSYYLTLNHYMAVTVGNFTSIFGMFAAILFMYYYLLYKSPEYNQRKRFKHFIHITNLIIIAFSTFVLVHLALKLFFSIYSIYEKAKLKSELCFNLSRLYHFQNSLYASFTNL